MGRSSMKRAWPSSSSRSSTLAIRRPICLGRSSAWDRSCSAVRRVGEIGTRSLDREKVQHYTFVRMANDREGAPVTGPIGQRMLRVEDRPLLTGEAEFVDDVALDGM